MRYTISEKKQVLNISQIYFLKSYILHKMSIFNDTFQKFQKQNSPTHEKRVFCLFVGVFVCLFVCLFSFFFSFFITFYILTSPRILRIYTSFIIKQCFLFCFVLFLLLFLFLFLFLFCVYEC